jgi:hypothetical protein
MLYAVETPHPTPKREAGDASGSRSKPLAAGAPEHPPREERAAEPYPQRLPSMPCRTLLNVLKKLETTAGPTKETPADHPSNHREEALILMSTPAGRLNLLSASIVLAVA